MFFFVCLWFVLFCDKNWFARDCDFYGEQKKQMPRMKKTDPKQTKNKTINKYEDCQVCSFCVGLYVRHF